MHRSESRVLAPQILLLAASALGSALLLHGCGAGSAVVASGLDDSAAEANAATVLSALEVTQTRVSPARIGFSLRDVEGDTVDVLLRFTPDVAAVPPTTIATLKSLSTASPGSDAAVPHSFDWDFAAALGSAFVEDVVITAQVVGASDSVVGSGSVLTDLGDSPPSIALAPQGADLIAVEQSGDVPIQVLVTDDSSDSVSLRLEFFDPDAGASGAWFPLRPTGIAQAAPTPIDTVPLAATTPFGFPTVATWDSSFDLAGRDVNTMVRVTAVELEAPFLSSPPLVLEPIQVDDNEPPSIAFDAEFFAASTDRTAGIPLQLTASDAEGDRGRIVVQWRLSGQGFPALPGTRAALDAVLDSPSARRLLQIATLKPPVEDAFVRADGSPSTSLPIEGRVDALGDGTLFETLSGLAPDVAPLAPHSVFEAGRHLLITDRGSGMDWSVRVAERVDIDSGDQVTAPIVPVDQPGSITSVCAVPGSDAFLVAVNDLPQWRLVRVEPGAATPQVLFEASFPPSNFPLAPTSIAATRGGVVYACDGQRLAMLVDASISILLDADDTPLLDAIDLVLVDPRDPNRVFLVDGDNGALFRYERPRALLEGVPVVGASLVGVRAGVMAEGGPGRAVLLAGTAANPIVIEASLPVADGSEGSAWLVRARTNALGPGVTALTAGSSGAIRAALPSGPITQLGGVLDSRTAIDGDYTQLLSQAVPGQALRIAQGLSSDVALEAGGTSVRFVWDSSDVIGNRTVFLRATMYDDDPSAPADSGALRVQPGTPLVTVPDPRVADLDGDGVVEDAAVFFGEFAVVAVGDVNGDGFGDGATFDGRILLGNTSPITTITLPGASMGTTYLDFEPRVRRTVRGAAPDLLWEADHVATDAPALSGINRQIGGSFQPPESFGFEGFVRDIESVDVNLDGDPDTVSQLAFSLTFLQSALLRTSLETLSVVQLDDTNSGRADIVITDLDENGLPDIAISEGVIYQSDVDTFLPIDRAQDEFGAPLGSLPSTEATVDLPFNFNAPATSATVDFDGDGLLDVIVFDQPQTVLYFRQVAPRAFELIAPADAPGPVNLEPGDFVSVIATSGSSFRFFDSSLPQSAEVSIEASRAVARLTNTGPTPILLVESGPTGGSGMFDAFSLDVGDFEVVDRDLDGALDVVFGAGSEVRVFDDIVNNPTTHTLVHTAGGSVESLVVCDFDGDRSLDVVHAVGGTLFTVPAGGGPSTMLTHTAFTGRLVACTDRDGDGLRDLVTTDGLLRQRAPGSFAFAPDDRAAEPDIDGDGRGDVLDLERIRFSR